MVHKHKFRALNNNSAGFVGILLYCESCGKAYTYDRYWNLIEAKKYETQ